MLHVPSSRASDVPDRARKASHSSLSSPPLSPLKDFTMKCEEELLQWANDEIEMVAQPCLEAVMSDDPVFYAQLDTMDEQARYMTQALRQILADQEKLTAAAKAHRSALKQFATTLTDSRSLFTVTSSDAREPVGIAAAALKKLADAMEERAQQAEAFTPAGIEDAINRYDACSDCKDQLDEAHTRYNVQMTKLCTTSIGDEGGSDDYRRRSKKAYLARRNAHLLAVDCATMFYELLSTEKVNVMRDIFKLVDAQGMALLPKQETSRAYDQTTSQLHHQLQNLQLRADSDARLELSQTESVRQLINERYESEYTAAPVENSRSGASSFQSTISHVRRVVGRRQGTSLKMRPRSKTASSGKWRSRSRRNVTRVAATSAAPEEEHESDPEIGGDDVVYDVELIAEKQGYVFRRLDRKWRLENMAIRGERLCHILDDGSEEELALLLLSSTRPLSVNERHHAIEVITPGGKIEFQALGPREYNEWMAALQAGVARALDKGNADDGDATVTADPATVLASVEGNHVCADCSKPEVEWASVNLGILLCIECSGIHRGLGVHFSKVRSVLLDRWTPEMLLHMCRVGNARANRRYEATLADHPTYTKPTRSTPKAEKERFTRAKYCDQLFMDESVPLEADLDDLGITDDSGSTSPTTPLPMSPGLAAAAKFKDFEKKASWFSQLDEMVSGRPGSAPEQGDAVASPQRESRPPSPSEVRRGPLSAAALKDMYERLEAASPGPLGRTRASEVISTSRRSSFANSDDNASGAEDDGEGNLGSPLARKTGDGATALLTSKLHRNSATRRKTSLSTEFKKKAQTLGNRAARLTASAFNGNSGGGSEGRPSLSAMDSDGQLDETEAVPTLKRDGESGPLSGSLGPDLFHERRAAVDAGLRDVMASYFTFGSQPLLQHPSRSRVASEASELSLPRMLRKSSMRCLNGDFDDDDMLDNSFEAPSGLFRGFPKFGRGANSGSRKLNAQSKASKLRQAPVRRTSGNKADAARATPSRHSSNGSAHHSGSSGHMQESSEDPPTLAASRDATTPSSSFAPIPAPSPASGSSNAPVNLVHQRLTGAGRVGSSSRFVVRRQSGDVAGLRKPNNDTAV